MSDIYKDIDTTDNNGVTIDREHDESVATTLLLKNSKHSNRKHTNNSKKSSKQQQPSSIYNGRQLSSLLDHCRTKSPTLNCTNNVDSYKQFNRHQQIMGQTSRWLVSVSRACKFGGHYGNESSARKSKADKKADSSGNKSAVEFDKLQSSETIVERPLLSSLDRSTINNDDDDATHSFRSQHYSTTDQLMTTHDDRSIESNINRCGSDLISATNQATELMVKNQCRSTTATGASNVHDLLHVCLGRELNSTHCCEINFMAPQNNNCCALVTGSSLENDDHSDQQQVPLATMITRPTMAHDVAAHLSLEDCSELESFDTLKPNNNGDKNVYQDYEGKLNDVEQQQPTQQHRRSSARKQQQQRHNTQTSHVSLAKGLDQLATLALPYRKSSVGSAKQLTLLRLNTCSTSALDADNTDSNRQAPAQAQAQIQASQRQQQQQQQQQPLSADVTSVNGTIKKSHRTLHYNQHNSIGCCCNIISNSNNNSNGDVPLCWPQQYQAIVTKSGTTTAAELAALSLTNVNTIDDGDNVGDNSCSLHSLHDVADDNVLVASSLQRRSCLHNSTTCDKTQQQLSSQSRDAGFITVADKYSTTKASDLPEVNDNNDVTPKHQANNYCLNVNSNVYDNNDRAPAPLASHSYYSSSVHTLNVNDDDDANNDNRYHYYVNNDNTCAIATTTTTLDAVTGYNLDDNLCNHKRQQTTLHDKCCDLVKSCEKLTNNISRQQQQQSYHRTTKNRATKNDQQQQQQLFHPTSGEQRIAKNFNSKSMDNIMASGAQLQRQSQIQSNNFKSKVGNNDDDNSISEQQTMNNGTDCYYYYYNNDCCYDYDTANYDYDKSYLQLTKDYSSPQSMVSSQCVNKQQQSDDNNDYMYRIYYSNHNLVPASVDKTATTSVVNLNMTKRQQEFYDNNNRQQQQQLVETSSSIDKSQYRNLTQTKLHTHTLCSRQCQCDSNDKCRQQQQQLQCKSNDNRNRNDCDNNSDNQRYDTQQMLPHESQQQQVAANDIRSSGPQQHVVIDITPNQSAHDQYIKLKNQYEPVQVRPSEHTVKDYCSSSSKKGESDLPKSRFTCHNQIHQQSDNFATTQRQHQSASPLDIPSTFGNAIVEVNNRNVAPTFEISSVSSVSSPIGPPSRAGIYVARPTSPEHNYQRTNTFNRLVERLAELAINLRSTVTDDSTSTDGVSVDADQTTRHRSLGHMTPSTSLSLRQDTPRFRRAHLGSSAGTGLRRSLTTRETVSTNATASSNGSRTVMAVTCAQPGTSHKQVSRRVPLVCSPASLSDLHLDSLSSSSSSSSSGEDNDDDNHNDDVVTGTDDIRGSAGTERCDDAVTIASSTTSSSLPFCKICHLGNKDNDRLISPCKCSGTMQYIHCSCLLKWLEISNRDSRKPLSCELCHYEYLWHRKFDLRSCRFPKCRLKDKLLHATFLLTICVMVACALIMLGLVRHDSSSSSSSSSSSITIPFPARSQQQQMHKFNTASSRSRYDSSVTQEQLHHHTQLSKEEKRTLICGVLFFLCFFLAMYVQIKARHTLYRLCAKFFRINQRFYITEYDHEQDVANHQSLSASTDNTVNEQLDHRTASANQSISAGTNDTARGHKVREARTNTWRIQQQYRQQQIRNQLFAGQANSNSSHNSRHN